MTTTGLAQWYGFMKSRDHEALWDPLHPDVIFESPVVHAPQRGRDITFKYLTGAVKVLGVPGFSYLGEWRQVALGEPLRRAHVLVGPGVRRMPIPSEIRPITASARSTTACPKTMMNGW